MTASHNPDAASNPMRGDRRAGTPARLSNLDMWFQIELPQVTTISEIQMDASIPGRDGIGGLPPGFGAGAGRTRRAGAQAAPPDRRRRPPRRPRAARRRIRRRPRPRLWRIGASGRQPRGPVAYSPPGVERRHVLGRADRARAAAARRRRPSRFVRCRRGSFALRKREPPPATNDGPFSRFACINPAVRPVGNQEAL